MWLNSWATEGNEEGESEVGKTAETFPEPWMDSGIVIRSVNWEMGTQEEIIALRRGAE